MVSDTHPKIEEFQLQMLRQASPWRKAHMFGQMCQTIKQLAYQGLRQRHPRASEAELRRRLADLMLGAELAEQVYGPTIYKIISNAN